jgi:hypothetical protein
MAPYDSAARKTNPYWDEVLEILNGRHVSFPVSDRLGAARNLLNEAFESVMLKKRSPADGVSWAQRELVKIFKEEM